YRHRHFARPRRFPGDGCICPLHPVAQEAGRGGRDAAVGGFCSIARRARPVSGAFRTARQAPRQTKDDKAETGQARGREEGGGSHAGRGEAEIAAQAGNRQGRGMMDLVLALATALLILVGTVFTFAAAIGINRFPDLYTRMHAASKAGTVGSALMLIAVGIHAAELSILARCLACFFFFVLPAPVSARLLAKAAHDSGYPLSGISVQDEMKGEDTRI